MILTSESMISRVALFEILPIKIMDKLPGKTYTTPESGQTLSTKL